MSEGETPLRLKNLRRRAEEALDQSHAGLGAGASLAKLREQLLELRVQHCELELQHAELLRIQLELQEAHDRHGELFDLAPVPYLMVDGSCGIVTANLAAAQLIGCDRRELLTRTLPDFVSDGDAPRFHPFWARVFETGSPQTCAVTLERPGAGELPVHLEAGLEDAAQGGVGIAMLDQLVAQGVE